MSTSDPVISLSTPADAIAAVPYLLGYEPHERLIIIGLSDRGRILVTGASKLADAFHHWPQLPHVAANGVTSMVLIGYGPAKLVTPLIDHMQCLVNAQEDIDLIDALRVTDGRYWSYHCSDISCCAPEGTPLADCTVVDTAFVAAGSMVEPNREAITAYLAPAPNASAVAAALATMEDPVDGEHSGVFIFAMEEASDGYMPTILQTAILGRRLSAEGGLDAAVTTVDQADADTDRVRLWIWLTRHLAGEYRAHAATVCAYAAWRSGNGALAADAVNLALSIQPQHELAQVVKLALDHAIEPDSIRDT